jgi:tRNA pseudouridine55 synthase
VVIHDLELLDMCLQGDVPQISLRVRCSKGTYIRTLGEDIGEALGCGGHLTHLRRIATGAFDESLCTTLQALEALEEGDRLALLSPVQTLLDGHTTVTLGAEDAGRFLSGLRRRGDWRDCELVAVYGPSPDDGASPALLGTAHVRAGELIPGRLLSPTDIRQIQETSPETAT